uniref:Uncharacterized protein n=1 Tax=Lygus hesperus TaxID=30085 RepID=A0A146M6G6_LYGHE
MLNETFQRGRRMYVDIATTQQIDRLLNRTSVNNGSPNSAGATGSPSRHDTSRGSLNTSSPLANLSREDIGQVQSNTFRNNDNRKSGFGGPSSPLSMADFNRDAFGTEQQPLAGSEFGCQNNGRDGETSLLYSSGGRTNFGSSDFALRRHTNRDDPSHLDSKAEPVSLSSFSRDMIGSAIQPSMSEMDTDQHKTRDESGGRRSFPIGSTANDNDHSNMNVSKERSYPTHPSSGIGKSSAASSLLANWRNEERLTQP